MNFFVDFVLQKLKKFQKGLDKASGGGDILSTIQDESYFFAGLAEFLRICNSPVLSYKFQEGFFNYEFNF